MRGQLSILPVHQFARDQKRDALMVKIFLFELILMSTLQTNFESAVASSKNLSERPDNSTMLKLYALYKQGSSGDATGTRPSFSDMVGRAKWDAWNGMKGTTSDAAKQQYIDLVESLS
jgi:diazepam-binding inhibitor (GABA receptor modulator, acyl-CoA-binding protein)